MENSKQLLGRIHRAFVRVQNSAGLTHIADVATLASNGVLTPAQVVDACAVVCMRATLEMALARALGDRHVGRFDLLVMAQIRDLLGADVAQATRILIETADGAIRTDIGDSPIATDWPAPLSPPTLPALPARSRPRIRWHVRIARMFWALFIP